MRNAIPGGAHTYSRGRDQFPSNAPGILERGQGAYVWTPDGERYLDYGMGLRSVGLGYAHARVSERVTASIQMGTNLTLPTRLELEAAEALIAQVSSVEMVKFAKHGSTVTTAAVKLARAATGKQHVAVSNQHPFHSFDDWFIAATVMRRGVPPSSDLSFKFDYGDVAQLERLLSHRRDEIAAVILEPGVGQVPCPAECGDTFRRNSACLACDKHQRNFLVEVRRLCTKYGVVMILDEIVTGFRWHAEGAQHMFGIEPDLTTFGKAMANGFPLAALGGRREFMDLGSIDRSGMERTFLMSSTHGSELVGLAAFLATLDVYAAEDVCGHFWRYGRDLATLWKSVASEFHVDSYITIEGPYAGQVFVARDESGNPSLEYKTLFAQEMARSGVLMPWLSPSLAHGENELRMTENALRRSFETYARALEDGVSAYLEGPAVLPVFRSHN
ncbi:glutamate-1-semialdehyde 2,1-aminomutase [bacterium]|nr:glutamate-1-semialdehyde 2,1-aminomutase [bacterium]